jgi:uncharacterized membrane protein (DUF373 family)
MESTIIVPEVQARRNRRSDHPYRRPDCARGLESCAEDFQEHFSERLRSDRLLLFQAVFGMIFTVIIALEFERSLLVMAERDRGVVQVRTVILIALLAIVRKLMIMDMATTDTQQLFALAAAILALGGVYWLVRDQDRREDA